jgi:hypothetical protein
VNSGVSRNLFEGYHFFRNPLALEHVLAPIGHRIEHHFFLRTPKHSSILLQFLIQGDHVKCIYSDLDITMHS